MNDARPSNTAVGALVLRRYPTIGDATLIGVFTLEEFGLVLDPVRRELRPMPMSLMPLGA